MATFTCIIPAFNEAGRIGDVLESVIGHPQLSTVIVVDDGSTDGTGDIAQAHGATLLRTAGNLGKTKALALGLQDIVTSHVVLIDADLSGLTVPMVTALIAPVMTGMSSAAISLRGNAPFVWRWIGIDYISGERVIPLSLLTGRLPDLARIPRFGFEVFLNQLLIAQDMPIAIVHWPDVASPSKARKRGRLSGLWADAAMIADIFRTIGLLSCLKQILALRRLRSGLS